MTGPARLLPYGFYPFWFWNGELSPDEIRWQIAEMAANGVRGFFIHSRQGLQQPYLSGTFMHLVELAVDCAEQHGLVVHLYDEYPYPSGVAGGEVILGQPQFQATRLVQDRFDVPGGSTRLALPRGLVLACVACPLNAAGAVDWTRLTDLQPQVGMVLTGESYNLGGLTSYNRKRYFASQPTPVVAVELPPVPHRIFVSVQCVVERHKYWWHFADVLNPAAVREFMRRTHERYGQRFGARFGKSIHSIFVDETAPGWSACIPALFRREYGYDLLPLLPALQDPTHPEHLRVAVDLHRLRYRRFCQTFERPISRWCTRHHLGYAGEKASLRLAQLRYMHIPGCEPGHTKAGAPMDLLQAGIRGNARATASAAYLYGKEGALCECYHSLGWGGTLQDAKLIADGLLLMGIRYLVPHGFFYTTHALAKHDAPPTFFFQMPYWPLFRHLTRRVDRIGRLFDGTHLAATVLVVEPTAGLPTPEQSDAYRRLLDLLMAEHLDFLLVDTDMLESAKVRAGRVRLRDVTASLVLVPPMRAMEPPLAAWLDGFEKQGGHVVRCGADFAPDELRDRLLETVSPWLHCRAIEGDARTIQVVSRTDGRHWLWFLLNPTAATVELELSAAESLHEIPLDDALPAGLAPGAGAYRRRLEPFESVLLTTAPDRVTAPAASPRVCVRLGGPATVTPLAPNLLRLHDWDLTVLDDDGVPRQTARVPAVPLANQLATGKFRFAPVLVETFGCMPEWRVPRLRLEYRCPFDCRYDGRVELVMEPGSIVGDWHLWINDAPALAPDQFSPTTAHVRGSLGVDISPLLRPGANSVRVAVTTDRTDGGLRNPLYLAGDFGVTVQPPQLTRRRAAGAFEKWEENGLPYYAGAVEYGLEVDLPELPTGDPILADFEAGPGFQDACEVSLNGGPWHALPWSPRRCLVRRAELRCGRNAVRVRVYTTLIRAFEGQWFDVECHRYRSVGEMGAAE
jgi:hypothetical protein